MNPRSIRFRLTTWYATLLCIIVLAFGTYIYQRLDHYLTEVITQSLSNRAERIADSLVKDIPRTGEQYVASEIKARYAPELNDRFIRVVRPDSTILYVSGVPNDNSFDPNSVPMQSGSSMVQKVHESMTSNGAKLWVLSHPVTVDGKRYYVEAGASEAGSRRVLERFVVTLLVGLPIVVAVATFGGSLLVKWALAPVQKIMGAAREITLHHLDKRLPQEKTGDEIEKLTMTLNQMISRLDRSFQMTNRFTADASHELRTPLTIMRGELEMLLGEKDLPKNVAETLGSLFEETERLSRIVEGLLALSRLDAGEAQMHSSRFDLAELAASTAQQMCLLAEEKEINLACNTGRAVEIEGDKSKLKQVIVNLLDNAIKYTPQHGKVELTVEALADKARLSISDSGPGIPLMALSHIFDRFYRADEVRSREVGGVGLGLSIVHAICTAHGGTIAAENLKPGGCRFTVEIPLAGKPPTNASV